MNLKKAEAIKTKLTKFNGILQQYEQVFKDAGGATLEEQQKIDDLRSIIDETQKQLTNILPEEQSSASSGRGVRSTDPKKIKGDEGTYKDVTTNSALKIAEVFSGKEIDGTDVHWNDVGQGAVGDCYFLAAIGAVAKANPQALRKLIKGPDKDDNYQVTLYIDGNIFSPRKATTVTITPEFYVDADGVPIYAQAGDTEMWVMLIEKAYAILRKKEKPLQTIFRRGYKSIEGGWGEEGIEVLTGEEASKHKIKNMSDDEIKTMLTSALADKRPITTSTIFGPKKGKKGNKKQVAAQGLNLILGHAYFVLEFDGSNITVQNPWNDENWEGDGRADITLSFEDYKKYYQTISVQDK